MTIGTARAVLTSNSGSYLNGEEYAVTVGVSGANVGFSYPGFSNYGSISPGTFRGISIYQMTYFTSQNRFGFWLQGIRSQNYFDRIIIDVENEEFVWNGGNLAIFDNLGGNTRWLWNASTPIPPTGWSNGNNRTVQILNP